MKPKSRMDLEMAVFLFFISSIIPVPVEARTPIFSWPLHDKSNIYEIVAGVPQDTSQAGIMYGDSMYDNVKTMAFDGFSYIDLNISIYSSFVDSTDYGYSVFFKTVEWSNRCVFHHVHTGAGTDVTEFKVWIDLLDLHVSRTVNDIVETAYVVGLVKRNTWQQVAFGFDQGKGKSIVYMEGNKFEFIWFKNKVFETPAKIRVGGCFDGSSFRFKGFITGLALFTSKLGGGDMSKLLTAYEDTTLQCYSETPAQTSKTGGICPTTTTAALTTTTPIPPPTLTFETTVYHSNRTVDSRRFVLPEENVLPDVLLDMAYYPDCTVYACGSRCMLDSACQSFSFQMVTATSGNCHLFADVYSVGLISSSQTYYYRLV